MSVTRDVATDELPVAIIGAGPIGLAVAAHLAREKVPFVVLEAGSQVGASVSEWGHVRLFSPWRYNDAGSAGLRRSRVAPPRAAPGRGAAWQRSTARHGSTAQQYDSAARQNGSTAHRGTNPAGPRDVSHHEA